MKIRKLWWSRFRSLDESSKGRKLTEGKQSLTLIKSTVKKRSKGFHFHIKIIISITLLNSGFLNSRIGNKFKKRKNQDINMKIRKLRWSRSRSLDEFSKGRKLTEGKRRSLCIFSIRPPRLLRFRRSTKKHLTRVCLFERATRHDESRERERLTRIREMRWKYNLYLLLRDLYLLKKKKPGEEIRRFQSYLRPRQSSVNNRAWLAYPLWYGNFSSKFFLPPTYSLVSVSFWKNLSVWPSYWQSCTTWGLLVYLIFFLDIIFTG